MQNKVSFYPMPYGIGFFTHYVFCLKEEHTQTFPKGEGYGGGFVVPTGGRLVIVPMGASSAYNLFCLGLFL